MNIKNTMLAVLVAVASIAAPFAANAADALLAPVPLDRPAVVSTVTHFDGPYAGFGVNITNDTYTPTLNAGIDARYDIFVVGGEAIIAINEDGIQTVGFDAKAGFVITDNVAVYGIVGVEVDADTAIARNSIGVGADIAVTDNVYVTASYRQTTDFGTFDNPDNQYRVGLKFPF